MERGYRVIYLCDIDQETTRELLLEMKRFYFEFFYGSQKY